MVQLLFFLLVFLVAILLHYMLVIEHFNNQGDRRCEILPKQLAGPADPRLNTDLLKLTYAACQLEATKLGGISSGQLLTINTELIRMWASVEAARAAATAATGAAGAATTAAPASGAAGAGAATTAATGAGAGAASGAGGAGAATTAATGAGAGAGAATTAAPASGVAAGAGAAPATAAPAAGAATTATGAAGATIAPPSSFSSMISALISSVPDQENQRLTSASYDPASRNSNAVGTHGSNAHLNQMQNIIHDELAFHYNPAEANIRDAVKNEVTFQLKDIKLGPKDTQNIALAHRNTAAVSAAVAQANSDGLVQGQDYRTDPSCAYANGQKAPKAEPYPIDMNDYVRKDSIPCWGCTLK